VEDWSTKQEYFILCSQGCCGSVHVRDCLQQPGINMRQTWMSMSKLNIMFHNQHFRNPPKSFNRKDYKVLYMYGDPRNILLSSLNRVRPGPKPGVNRWNWHLYCKYMQADVEYFGDSEERTIDRLLQDNYDPLRLEDHFLSWLNVNAEYPLMLLKYEALEEPKTFQHVLDFFEVEGDYSYGWRPRETSYLKLTLEQQVQITELFKDLLKIQAEIPPVYIR